MRTHLAILLFVAACGGVDSIDDHEVGTTDSVIGDACISSQDCFNSCYSDADDFPGGFCSVPCATDANCPEDAVCIDKDGGVCLFSCPPFDCSFLGPGYQCKNKENFSGQDRRVCIGD